MVHTSWDKYALNSFASGGGAKKGLDLSWWSTFLETIRGGGW